MAHLGSDNLYHLVSEAGLWCGSLTQTRCVVPQLEHVLSQRERVPKWWGDARSGQWSVTLDGEAFGPELVPYVERCPLPPRIGAWLPYCGGKSPESRIRKTLIDTLGRACGICGVAPGITVDHDHFSGLVRGLLCIDCNGRVDWCPHLRNCAFADYLNNAPAADLGMQYKGKLRDYENRARAAAIGATSIRQTSVVSGWRWQAPKSPCTLVQCHTRRVQGVECCKVVPARESRNARG